MGFVNDKETQEKSKLKNCKALFNLQSWACFAIRIIYAVGKNWIQNGYTQTYICNNLLCIYAVFWGTSHSNVAHSALGKVVWIFHND